MLSDKTQCLIGEIKRIVLRYMSEEEVSLFLLLSSPLIDQVINDPEISDSLKCHQIQLIASSAVYQARSCGHVGDESQLNDDLDTKIKHFFEITSTKWRKSTRGLVEDVVETIIPTTELTKPTTEPSKPTTEPTKPTSEATTDQPGIEVEDAEDTLVEVIMAPENVSFFLRVVRVVGDLLLTLFTTLTKPSKKKKKKKNKKDNKKEETPTTTNV